MKKIITILLLATIAIGSLSVAITFANAEPNMNLGMSNAMMIRRSAVRLDGLVTSWGTDKTNGTLVAQAVATTVNSILKGGSTSASAIWNITKVNKNGNFTYSFSAAKLIKANYTALDFQTNNFFMNGTWNAYTVTITSTVITTGDVNSHYTSDRQSHTDITNIASQAYGELNVTNNWSQFTLSIKGIDQLNGTVHRSITRQMEFNKYKVNEDGTDTVTKQDLMTVAKSYGAMPGMDAYDQKLDVNMHYKVDITDIATVAANIKQ